MPHDSYLLSLRPRTKLPATDRAHYDAIAQSTFVILGNYGIRLDPQFIVIDFDATDPQRDRIEMTLPKTWSQRTPGGVHYLFRVPNGWRGTNRDLVVGTGTQRRKIGDVKCHGYIVGPGSAVDAARGRPAGAYTLLEGVDPAIAPEWLLDFAKARDDVPQINGADAAEDRGRIAIGENDNELFKLASYFRHRGFDADFIKTALAGVLDSGVVEQVPGNEYTPADLERLARSATKYAAGSGKEDWAVTPAAWQTTEDLPRMGDTPLEWILDDYIPQGALAMLYGKGGVGKSTFVAWLAAKVTRSGRLFGFVGAGEETPEMFAAKVQACGGDVALLRYLKAGTTLRIPRDCAKLRDSIELMGLACVYFDAYRSHMQRAEGANEADRTRDALQPLSEVAVLTKCTILCTTHTTKYSDEMLGSVEVENVARVALRVFEPKKARGQVCVVVKKANFKKPEGAIVYTIESTPLKDPITGRTQMQRRESGTVEPLTMGFIQRCEVNAIVLEELDEKASVKEPGT